MQQGRVAREQESSLREGLAYEPQELAFGTSGLRGRVVDITQLEAYINTVGFMRYLFARQADQGGILPGDPVFLASDFRPSSDSLVPEQGGRGEIVQAVARAIQDEGCSVVYLGKLPTPGLTYYALSLRTASVMVTGSHIPFDRNGIKFNKSNGEVLKEDEPGILAAVAEVRRQLYGQPLAGSIFDGNGMLRPEERRDAPAPVADGYAVYMRRYQDFFAGLRLDGLRVVVYQHSSLARTLLVELLESFGARVVPTGLSDTFVPIDTEDIGPEALANLQALVDAVPGRVDAIVSTDGDSDRPLIVSVDNREDGSKKVRFHGGDLIGIVVASYLDADGVVVPISANDAVDRVFGERLLPKSRIGSPYVIAGMLAAQGRRRVVGFEANGGFLTGSDIERHGHVLRALPTRDAVLPILSVLFAARDLARENGQPFSIAALFDRLPRRFSKAGLLDRFPVDRSRAILARFAPTDRQVGTVGFQGDEVRTAPLPGADPRVGPLEAVAPAAETGRMRAIRTELESIFSREAGFGALVGINYLDGLRMYFDNGDVAHVRPSGNAPQLRIYATADSQERADAIVAAALAEPDGTLRRLEGLVR